VRRVVDARTTDAGSGINLMDVGVRREKTVSGRAGEPPDRDAA